MPLGVDGEARSQEELPDTEKDIIRWEEVKKARNHVKNKSAGYDGPPVEIFSKGGDTMITWLHSIFNAACKHKQAVFLMTAEKLPYAQSSTRERAQWGNNIDISAATHLPDL